MAQVAKAAGVSRATVSRVLADSPLVEESTREHVLAIARSLGYVRNAAATQLAGQPGDTIGLLLRDTRNPAYADLYTAMLNTAQDYGLFITMMSAGRAHRHGGETNQLERLLSLRPAGIFVCSGLIASQEIEPFANQVPTIVLPRPETAPTLHNIAYDETGNGHIIADFVADRGHRAAAVLVTPPDVSYVENLRANAICERLSARGVTPVPIDGVLLHSPTELARQLGARSRLGEFSVAMFPNDVHALTFLTEARDLGIRVPDDLSVTGIDGAGLATAVAGLSTVAVPIPEAATAAIEHMRRLVEAPHVPTPTIREVYTSHLVPGATVAEIY